MNADSDVPGWRAPAIEPIADPARTRRVRHRLDQQTKPPGSLGRLESLALQMALVQRTDTPALHEPQLVVFAADHGLAAQGVSAYPPEVTVQMVNNMLSGGAAVSVLARQHGLGLTMVDAGIAHALPARPGLLDRAVARGTMDASLGPAMTESQCDQALAAGAGVLAGLPGNVLLTGEMGIGNSSSAALLLARLADLPLDACVGRGTGMDDAGLDRKRRVLQRVLDRHAAVDSPRALLAAVGGFEIAMLAGAVLRAAHERRLIVVDGFITGAAVLAARAMAPAVVDYCVFSHRSQEAGHAAMLRALGAQPLLDLGLRLGEGSGAALAWPLVRSAERLLTEMATFASAGVSTRVPDGPRAAH